MTNNINIETKVIGNLISWLVINTYASPERVKIAEILSAAEKQRQQEPVAWQFYQDGEWHNGSNKNNHKQNTIDAGIAIRELFTTTPSQSLKSVINETVDKVTTILAEHGIYGDGIIGTKIRALKEGN